MMSIFGDFTEEPMMLESILPSKPSHEGYIALEYYNSFGIFCITRGIVIARVSKQWSIVGDQVIAARKIAQILSEHFDRPHGFSQGVESKRNRFQLCVQGGRVDVFDRQTNQPIIVIPDHFLTEVERNEIAGRITTLLNVFFQGPT